MSERSDKAVAMAMKRMTEISERRSVPDPFEGPRREAYRRIRRNEDFMSIADDLKVSGRTLLVWYAYETNGIWGDHAVEYPGPTDQYSGDWPSPKEELELYADRGVDPARIADTALRRRYRRLLNKKKENDLPEFGPHCKSGEMTPFDELMALMDEEFGKSEGGDPVDKPDPTPNP